MSRPSLIVMAAGMGSRYGGLKQIDPIGPAGEVVIDYSIHDAVAAGFGKVIFVIRRDFEQAFRDGVGARVAPHVEVAYVHQELTALPPGFSVPPGRSKPWGTGHAVLSCAPEIDGPFAVINADDFYGRASFAALASHLGRARDARDWAMIGFRLRNTLSEHGHVARGLCVVGDDDTLESIVERTRIEPRDDGAAYSEDGGATWVDVDPDTPVSMNMWGFTPYLLTELEARFPRFLREHGDDPKSELYVPSVVGELLAEGAARVTVLPTPERWVGVTYKQDLSAVRAAVRAMIDAGLYPERLWA